MITIAGGIILAVLILCFWLEILEFTTVAIYKAIPWVIFIAIMYFVIELIA